MTAPPRIGELIRLLSSDKDGEVVAAAGALGRTLRNLGFDWHDLANTVEARLGELTVQPLVWPEQPPLNWRRVLEQCFSFTGPEVLREKEIDFLDSMRRWRGLPTKKQWQWLVNIATRLDIEPPRSPA